MRGKCQHCSELLDTFEHHCQHRPTKLGKHYWDLLLAQLTASNNCPSVLEQYCLQLLDPFPDHRQPLPCSAKSSILGLSLSAGSRWVRPDKAFIVQCLVNRVALSNTGCTSLLFFFFFFCCDNEITYLVMNWIGSIPVRSLHWQRGR